MSGYRKLLITGSTGVLGYAFQELAPQYEEYEFVFSTRQQCDLRDLKTTVAHVRAVGPEAILHLAAASGGLTLSLKHPAALLRDGVLMTVNLLEAARQVGVRKIVMTLSAGMYPPSAAVPIKESAIHDGPAHESNYSYAYAKRLIEPAIRAYRAEYGLNAIGLVPNGIVGPGDKFDREDATFIAALIKRCFDHRDDQSPLVVWGDGSPLREVTFSHDVARAFLWGLERYDEPDILNVGTMEEHSIKEIAFMIAEELGIDCRRLVFDVSQPSGVFRKGTDNSRFVALSQFRYTPLREGLRKTLDWLRAQQRVLVAG